MPNENSLSILDENDTSATEYSEEQGLNCKSYLDEEKQTLTRLLNDDHPCDGDIQEEAPQLDSIFRNIPLTLNENAVKYKFGKIISIIQPYAVIDPLDVKFVLDTGTLVVSMKDNNVLGAVNFIEIFGSMT